MCSLSTTAGVTARLSHPQWLRRDCSRRCACVREASCAIHLLSLILRTLPHDLLQHPPVLSLSCLSCTQPRSLAAERSSCSIDERSRKLKAVHVTHVRQRVKVTHVSTHALALRLCMCLPSLPDFVKRDEKEAEKQMSGRESRGVLGAHVPGTEAHGKREGESEEDRE